MKSSIKAYTSKHQRGAVLAFTLMILLLLTLASISMIKQNKVQIAIATNAGQQVSAFASVETAVGKAMTALETLRYANTTAANKATHHCKSGATNSLHPYPDATGSLTGLPTGVTAQIKEVYCLSGYGSSTKTGSEARCLYSGTGTRNVTAGTGTPAATAANVSACQKLTAAGGWVDGTPNANACEIEVYLTYISFADAAGTQRTIESKLEIDCTGDLNAKNCTDTTSPIDCDGNLRP